jgi:hypothetical protein
MYYSEPPKTLEELEEELEQKQIAKEIQEDILFEEMRTNYVW